MPHPLIDLVSARHGHFKLETGYHINPWLELEPMFLKPDRLQPFVAELADRLSHHSIDSICGPLIGGAFLAKSITRELGKDFFYTERIVPQDHSAKYSLRDELPKSLRTFISGKRVAIVDDAISAGLAVRGTFTKLKEHNSQPISFSALLLPGNVFQPFCVNENIALETIENLPFDLWLPDDYPLCGSNTPLEIAAQ